MHQFKTLLMAAAISALPCAAAAQLGGLTDKAKDAAVDTVLDKATPQDAITGGSVIFKGGSREDAAVAIVKNRAESKVEGVVGDRVGGITGGSSGGIAGQVGGVVSGGAPSSATIYNEAKGSATTYQEPKPQGSSTVYSDGAKGSATTYSGQGSQGSAPTYSAPAATTGAPVNCPAGTTAQPNGTCMITGNWGG